MRQVGFVSALAKCPPVEVSWFPPIPVSMADTQIYLAEQLSSAGLWSLIMHFNGQQRPDWFGGSSAKNGVAVSVKQSMNLIAVSGIVRSEGLSHTSESL